MNAKSKAMKGNENQQMTSIYQISILGQDLPDDQRATRAARGPEVWAERESDRWRVSKPTSSLRQSNVAGWEIDYKWRLMGKSSINV